MPIEFGSELKLISKQDFYQMDYKMMEIAFSIHNEFGRFWDEKIYQRELVRRCQVEGLGDVRAEVPIVVIFNDFKKYYFLDLLINSAGVYELKTVAKLDTEHQRQILNYLFLLGLSYGKLINFRPSSVEYRFVTTTVETQDRFQFAIDDSNWINLEPESAWLKEFMIELLQEWGAYLDTSLFYQAINFFRGGEENVVQHVGVYSGTVELGVQRMNLLTPKIAFKLSSIRNDLAYYERHLSRCLHHTHLEAIQWINFNRKTITFKTIK